MMTKLPKKIVLCGVSGSGKSTLGDAFHASFGHSPVAFADPLKQAAQAVFGFADGDLWGPSHTRERAYPEFEFSGWCFECHAQCAGPAAHFLSVDERQDPRVIASVEREHSGDPDYWICESCGAHYPRFVTPREALRTLGTGWGRRFCPDVWATSCFVRMRPDSSYVVTDCRFENERRIAMKHQACVVLLLRGLDASTSPHPSEAEVRAAAEDHYNFDLVLDNTSGSPTENFDKLLVAFNLLSEYDDRHGFTCRDWGTYEDRRRGL